MFGFSLILNDAWSDDGLNRRPKLVTIVKWNNENHSLDTRQRNNLYFPQANLTIYQKGAYYSGITIFNNLPLEIKNVAGNKKKIKIAVKKKFINLFILHTGRVP